MLKTDLSATEATRYHFPDEPAAPTEIHTNILIVGSGPIGSTFARILSAAYPTKKIIMVEAGSQLSIKPGTNAKNSYIYNYDEEGLDKLSQIVKGELIPTSRPTSNPSPETLAPISQPVVPTVKYQINSGNPDQQEWDNIPAAASSFKVGGMGAHWTCCTPRPTPAERIPFIEDDEWEDLITQAEAILQTNQVSFNDSLRGQVIRKALSDVFDSTLPEHGQVQMLPLACKRETPRWVEWTGVDTILGSLCEAREGGNFELWPETLCKELLLNPDRDTVIGAVVERLKEGKKLVIRAEIVIIAANAFNTPQLLWKSGIRPDALGRFLNDQPMLFCQIVLKHNLLSEIASLWSPPPTQVDPVPIPVDDQIPHVWIPFSYPEHPYHSQIHRDAFSYSILPSDLGVDHRSIVDLRWFARKEVRYEDRITFSSEYVDMYGMPQVTFHYSLSPSDEATIDGALQDMTKAASALGGYLPGSEPRVLPRGSSLHFQGTFRMGEHNDPSQSVCDPYSKVWGFKNLYLGGNGIIPTSTACNPTLTSMTLAIRACRKIIQEWNPET